MGAAQCSRRTNITTSFSKRFGRREHWQRRRDAKQVIARFQTCPRGSFETTRKNMGSTLRRPPHTSASVVLFPTRVISVPGRRRDCAASDLGGRWPGDSLVSRFSVCAGGESSSPETRQDEASESLPMPSSSSSSSTCSTSSSSAPLYFPSVEEAVKAGHAIKNVIKVGRRGICDDLVQHIRKRWNTSTVVKLRCSGKRANDMKVLASELEEQTGGTVLFRSGGTIILHAPGI